MNVVLRGATLPRFVGEELVFWGVYNGDGGGVGGCGYGRGRSGVGLFFYLVSFCVCELIFFLYRSGGVASYRFYFGFIDVSFFYMCFRPFEKEVRVGGLGDIARGEGQWGEVLRRVE